MAEVASAFVSIAPDASGFGRKLDSTIGGDLDSSGKKAGSKFGTALKAGALGILAAGGAAAAVFLKGSIEEAREAQKVGALTASTIKATGSAAGVTAKQVGDLAGAISLKTGIDDETIQSGQNMLLTFKNIRNEVGKGNDIFNQSTKTLVDMSAAMGTEPKQAAIQLGKALNDPIKGISALSRVGVTFTEKQKKVIEGLVKGGKTAEAQKIILAELNSEFGGAAAAQATASDKMAVAWGNLQEAAGTALLPLIDKLLPKLTDAMGWLSDKGVPAARKFAGEALNLGRDVGSDLLPTLKTLAGIARDLAGFFGDLPGPVRTFGIEAAAAALLLPRLTGAIGSAKTAAGGMVTNLRSAETRTAALSSAARTAAGTAGMLALTQGVGKADTAIGALETTAGAAAIGFAVGGPWGAAIGAATGGVFSLWKMIDKSHDVMTSAEIQTNQYADSIDRIAAASGRAQRAEALSMLQREKGLIPSARAAGIATSDLISGLLGSEKAMKRVNAAFRANGSVSVAQGIEIQKISKFLSDQGFALRRHQDDLKDDQRAVQGSRQEFAKVPASVQKLNASLRNVGRTKSDMGKFTAFFRNDLDHVRSDADDRARKINDLLFNTTGKARPNLGPFRSDLLQQINAAQATASSGGQGIGSNLKAGIVSGFSGAAAQLATDAFNAVAGAVQAANRAADNKSPSKKMRQVGRYMAEGLSLGIQDRGGLAAQSMDRLVGGMVHRGPSLSAAGGGGGRATFHIYDSAGVLIETMDGRIAAHNRLEGETARAM